MTYSIVARDAETGQLGVAVQSRAFRVGMCAWAQPGVGAVATQSFTEPGYGPRSLAALAAGAAPADALAELLAADEQRELRQVAVLAADGRTAAHTGADCISDCGHVCREDVSAQGNMLASPGVWPAIADAFDASAGDLVERLLAALDAGEAAGGDFRGRQSAALVVVSGDVGDDPWARVVDLRVDDHADPLGELRRLVGLWRAQRRRATFGPETSLDNEVELARAAGMREDEVALTAALVATKHGDVEAVAAALRPFAETDARWREAFALHERRGYLPPGIGERL